jgi:membrane protein DedA with SNARE-associated domain
MAIQDWGIGGILLSLLIEGSAFPFIGTFFIVTMGFLLDLTWFELAWISVLGSLLYTLGSYIPYYIGYKLENKLLVKMSPARRASLEKAKAAFGKYGIWSVAISSPLHLGNVVPFLAGMSNMKLRTYTLLTMLGIAPSTFLLLAVGRLYPGDKETVMQAIVDYQSIILAVFVVITLLYAGWKWYGTRRKKKAAAG